MSKRVALFFMLILASAAMMFLTGCNQQPTIQKSEYQMGERVVVGPLTYNVIESAWRSQLGSEFKIRVPQQRFLLITISCTNGGGKEVSVPLLTLENDNGQSFHELDDVEGIDSPFGIFRNISPAQTQQGRLLFDVPLSSYKLRLTDGGDPANEKYAWVKIDLHMDQDTSVEAPSPEAPAVKK